MSERQTSPQKAVVVHRGARDAYQVAAALAEAGLLDCLVTDLYWPNDRRWGSGLVNCLPGSARQMLLARYSCLVPSKIVQQTPLSGIVSQLLDMLPQIPFAWRKQATRWNDTVLGRTAGQRALDTHSSLLSYSYYGFQAFSTHGKPGILFQAHPHPASVRRILQRELEVHPECADSLNQEWELSLPPEEFERLVEETKMASHTLVASSFTRQTLMENGIAKSTIGVIPYGVDLRRFSPGTAASRPISSSPLKLLFVGRINQRKGIAYLLEALRLLGSKNVELTVCGRVMDNLSIFNSFGSQVTIRPSVSETELLAAYRAADLFVFPSVVEGFGQVLLEALACGLPILSTTRTAAPDLITEGVEGFVVEPCRPDLLAGRIEWAMANRKALSEMRESVSLRAAHFSWARFRKSVVAAVLAVQAVQGTAPEASAQHV